MGIQKNMVSDQNLEHSTNISINVITIFAGAMAFIVGFAFKSILEHSFASVTHSRWVKIGFWIIAMGIAVGVSLLVNNSLRTHYETLEQLALKKECQEKANKLMSNTMDTVQKEIVYQSMEQCDETVLKQAQDSYRCTQLYDRYNNSNRDDDGMSQQMGNYKQCYNIRQLKQLETCRNHVIEMESLGFAESAKHYIDVRSPDFSKCNDAIVKRADKVKECIKIHDKLVKYDKPILHDDDVLYFPNTDTHVEFSSCFNKDEIVQLLNKHDIFGKGQDMDSPLDVDSPLDEFGVDQADNDDY